MLQATDPVLDALRSRGADPAALSRAALEADASHRPLRDVLVANQLVSEVELAEATAAVYGLKTIDLNGYPIDSAASEKIPLAMAKRHGVLGIALHGFEIVVAISDPGDVVALDDIRAATGMVV
jgi:type IV pilus assembly protein PilB